MLHDVDERVPVAVPERVDRVDVGVRLERRLDERARAVGRREPAEVRAEEELRHQPEEEDGRGVDEDPEETAASVDPRVAVAAREKAERHADDDRDDHRVEGQLDRGHPVLDDDVADRSPVRDRRPEVAARDVGQIGAVLVVDRPVVAELVLDLVHDGRRDVAAERGRDRVSRRDPHQQEDERQQDEDHRHDEREARQCVLSKRGPFATSHGRPFVPRRPRPGGADRLP